MTALAASTETSSPTAVEVGLIGGSAWAWGEARRLASEGKTGCWIRESASPRLPPIAPIDTDGTGPSHWSWIEGRQRGRLSERADGEISNIQRRAAAEARALLGHLQGRTWPVETPLPGVVPLDIDGWIDGKLARFPLKGWEIVRPSSARLRWGGWTVAVDTEGRVITCRSLVSERIGVARRSLRVWRVRWRLPPHMLPDPLGAGCVLLDASRPILAFRRPDTDAEAWEWWGATPAGTGPPTVSELRERAADAIPGLGHCLPNDVDIEFPHEMTSTPLPEHIEVPWWAGWRGRVL